MKTIAILSLFLIACAAPAVPPPASQESAMAQSDSDPDIRGAVTKIEGNRVLIESTPAEQRGEKAVVTITDDTVVRDANGRAASASAIRVGQTVRAWYTGAVMKSYPLQATAARIEIE